MKRTHLQVTDVADREIIFNKNNRRKFQKYWERDNHSGTKVLEHWTDNTIKQPLQGIS
jgi:hypothetical protein